MSPIAYTIQIILWIPRDQTVYDLHTWAGIGLSVQMKFLPVFNQSSSQGQEE